MAAEAEIPRDRHMSGRRYCGRACAGLGRACGYQPTGITGGIARSNKVAIEGDGGAVTNLKSSTAGKRVVGRHQVNGDLAVGSGDVDVICGGGSNVAVELERAAVVADGGADIFEM